MNMDINSVFHEQRITFIDCLAIVMLCAILNQLYRHRRPQDEQGKKGRRNALIGVGCLLLYAAGRIILIQVNQL